MRKAIYLFTMASIILISCSKGSGGSSPNNTNNNNNNNNNNNTTCTGTKSFANDVNPIIQASCAISGCHNAGSTNGPGALTSYQQIFNARSNISVAVGNGTMPKTGSITADQKNAILCWISGGAPNN
jgi:hypothetical protein